MSLTEVQRFDVEQLEGRTMYAAQPIYTPAAVVRPAATTVKLLAVAPIPTTKVAQPVIAATKPATTTAAATKPATTAVTKAATTKAVADPLSVTFDDRGLSNLTYKGVTLISAANRQADGFQILRYYRRTGDGPRVAVESLLVHDHTTTWDLPTRTMTATFAWGTVSCQYVVGPSKLGLVVKVVNNSSDTIDGVNVEPFALRFPKRPGIDLSKGMVVATGLDGPGALVADYGTGEAVLVTDGSQSVYTELFAWRDANLNTRYDVRIAGAPAWTKSNVYPEFFRPVAPGQTDTYTAELRLTASGTPASAVTSDLAAAYAARTRPYVLKWDDRRVITDLAPSNSDAKGRSATNPRGWFNDPKVNVTTDAGRAAFKQRLLAYADNSIKVMKYLNAQGMITWNLEGEELPQGITYVGDPRLADQLAPELAYDGTADAYFKRFRDAGLRVGVTIRPTQLVGTGAAALQVAVDDPAALLNAKIAYAKQRWGCTLFYVDSNNAFDAEVMAKVAAANPDCLILPEHQGTATYASTMPYEEVRQGSTGTPADVLRTYPAAAMVLSISNVANIGSYKAQLAASVKRGDILMVHGWYNAPENATAMAAYAAAGKAALKPVGALVPAGFTERSATVPATAAASQPVIGGTNLTGEKLDLNTVPDVQVLPPQ